MAKKSHLVLATVHYPPYVTDDLQTCLRRIVEKKVMVPSGDFLYTICRLQSMPSDKGFAGEMLKLSRTAKETYFDAVKWEPIEKEVPRGQVLVSSRFLVGPHNTIVIEDRPPHLSRTRFVNVLVDLLNKALDAAIFEIRVTFVSDPERIRRFVWEHERIVKISIQKVILKNPYLDTKKTEAARRFLQENKIDRGRIENKEEGLAKDGSFVEGVLGLAEEGQVDAKVFGQKRDMTIDTLEPKNKLFETHLKIEDGIMSFAHHAQRFMNRYFSRTRKKLGD